MTFHRHSLETTDSHSSGPGLVDGFGHLVVAMTASEHEADRKRGSKRAECSAANCARGNSSGRPRRVAAAWPIRENVRSIPGRTSVR
jgi:hypothetical protein